LLGDYPHSWSTN
jgi:hypothetical protein